ncbi:MAG TPA: RNA polymerase sigma factor [Burkholderiaceae bacterium]|nr:RNA polymerase sigma factor [Burkholderiaceae bacterium]
MTGRRSDAQAPEAGAPLAAAGFEALVRAHQSRVRQQLRRLTRGDHALADDLAQETFVQAWRHIGTFRGEARVSTWLYRIAYNAFLAHQRTGAGRAVALHDEVAGDDVAQADGAPGIGLRMDVARALDRLAEPERVALVHCFQLDLSHAEAAEVLGWPLGTLKSHVARGKARLREQLQAWQHGDGA